MTRIFPVEKACFVCGQKSSYTVIGSTNQLRPPDLDTRPGEMMRSTLPYWVQECPDCGYCAPDISAGPLIAADVIESEPYLAQKRDKRYPELANSFLCWALIQEQDEDYSGAGWAAVHAAWACDDEPMAEAAVHCRRKALVLFQQAETFARGPGAEEAIIADLLRRSHQFDQVAAVCRAGLAKDPPKQIAALLQLQQKLARQEDAGSHPVPTEA